MLPKIRNARSDADDVWYDRTMDQSLNRWFASYEDARRSLRDIGGFLLPFRHQFVVVEEAAIRALGLDPADPDWAAIGHDLVRPENEPAFIRLRQKREAKRKQRP